MEFDLPKDQSSIIKVIGVGGGGSNAVNHMYKQGITGVDFMICNTDQQALDLSPVPNKIQLGATLTEGRGAGSNPEVGKNAAIENVDELKDILEKNTQMVFITAGMGGGTGTGAAPIIAQTAREMGILTVGIVTIPFTFEGRRRKLQADEGLAQLRENVDTLLIICNDKLREMHGNLKISEAFSKADDILTVAAKGIAEIITVAGYINVDFEDVKTVMKDGGTAIMGSAAAEGESRATKAVSQALASPLLNDNDITGANYILLNITSGDEEVSMDEIDEIVMDWDNYVNERKIWVTETNCNGDYGYPPPPTSQLPGRSEQCARITGQRADALCGNKKSYGNIDKRCGIGSIATLESLVTVARISWWNTHQTNKNNSTKTFDAMLVSATGELYPAGKAIANGLERTTDCS